MPGVVVAGGIIQCSHGGQLKLSGGRSELEVGGAQAIVAGAEGGLSFAPGAPGVLAPCPWMDTKPPVPPPSPCTSSSAVAGISALLAIGGIGVLLDTATGPATNPADPAATWSVANAGQALLSIDR